MKISDLFRFSTDNLRRRKGRTILTVIGVVVGVCAIVVMISLGIAVNVKTDEMMKQAGNLTKIDVYGYGSKETAPLDDAMVKKFKTFPHVMAATPMYPSYSFQSSISAGKNGRYATDWIQTFGMDYTATEPMGYTLSTGKYLDGQKLGKNKIPVLIGAQAVFQFYDTKKSPSSMDYMKIQDNGENYESVIPLNLPKYDKNGVLLNPEESFFDLMKTPLTFKMTYEYNDNGEPVTKDYELVVVGVLDAVPSMYEVSYGIIMSMEDMRGLERDYKKLTKTSGSSGGSGNSGVSSYNRMGETTNANKYDVIYVKVDDVANIEDVEKAIRAEGFEIQSAIEERNLMRKQVAQTQMMLGGLAAISLFVAALNIMNTMTMAIYERTKEIGVMKVLGCNLGNIRTMFLIESGTIGLIGGVVGVVVSLLISLTLNYLPKLLMFLGVESSINFEGLFGNSGIMEQMAGGRISIIPPWLLLLALAFATFVGLVSGIAPANHAVKISSLEAIRHE